VLASRCLNDELFDAVWRRCLRGDEYGAELSHPVLLFNLSCFEARIGNKHGMLHFAERALERGKLPDQFRKDSDFEAYRQDPDFEALLLRYGAPLGS
jgi:hypothetical protein